MEEENIIVDKNLEGFLAEQNICSFPHSVDYKSRYQSIKDALESYHKNTVTGALLVDIEKFLKTRKSKASYVTYLNNHGLEHVNAVIRKASEILITSKCAISPYECYILLCAIQFHDVGIIFGRDDHEVKCKEIMKDLPKEMPDGFENNIIFKIASVHSGNYKKDKDIIQRLKPDRMIHEHKVRKRFLAALLRFADELADDSTRADSFMLKLEKIPPASEAFHFYSKSLHSVLVEKDSINLHYYFEHPLVLKQITRLNKKCYLLDEIYDRTLKMHRERIYCMRFMRPYINIEKISTEISILKVDGFDKHKISYTMQEEGYPSHAAKKIIDIAPKVESGEELKAIFEEEL